MKDFAKSKVVIVVGAGGVGKTTVASALGVYFARRGQKTLVITVDPARRLLDALAVKDVSDEPRRVQVDGLLDNNSSSRGSLFVFMPNLKKEWADFLSSAIEQAATREKIASNHFYRYMAEGMPGALEIICSHVLFRLMKSGDYDKIILDTPPSSHSISFFDVPQKISRVLEQGIFRTLMNRRHSMVARLTKKIAFFSGGILEKTFERIIGSHFLSELIDFALTIDALYEPLLHRVRAMDALLKSADTKYALIIKPTAASIKDSIYVRGALLARGIILHQILINQVMPTLDDDNLRREIAALKEHASAYASIAPLIDLYQREQNLEAYFLAEVRKQFSRTPKQLLYLTEATLSRSELLMRLVLDLEREGAA